MYCVILNLESAAQWFWGGGGGSVVSCTSNHEIGQDPDQESGYNRRDSETGKELFKYYFIIKNEFDNKFSLVMKTKFIPFKAYTCIHSQKVKNN